MCHRNAYESFYFCILLLFTNKSKQCYPARIRSSQNEPFLGGATLRTKRPTGAHSRSLSHTVIPEPPEFEVIGFMDHINVTVKFPPVTPKIYGESIWEVLSPKSFFIEELAGKNVKTVSASSGSDQSDAKLAVDVPHYLFKSCVKPGCFCRVRVLHSALQREMGQG